MKALTDKQEIERLMNSARAHNEANFLKQLAKEDGFQYWLSLYGVLTNPKTNHSEYRRIEILSNIPYDGQNVELIYRFFQRTHPVKYYTLWLFDGQDNSTVQIGEW